MCSQRPGRGEAEAQRGTCTVGVGGARLYGIFEEQGRPVSHVEVSKALPHEGSSAVRSAVTLARVRWRERHDDAPPTPLQVLRAVRSLWEPPHGALSAPKTLEKLKASMPGVTFEQVRLATARLRDPQAARASYSEEKPMWDDEQARYVYPAAGDHSGAATYPQAPRAIAAATVTAAALAAATVTSTTVAATALTTTTVATALTTTTVPSSALTAALASTAVASTSLTATVATTTVASSSVPTSLASSTLAASDGMLLAQALMPRRALLW